MILRARLKPFQTKNRARSETLAEDYAAKWEGVSPPQDDEIGRGVAIDIVIELRAAAITVRSDRLNFNGGAEIGEIAKDVRDSARSVVARIYGTSDIKLRDLAQQLSDVAHAYIGAATEGDQMDRNEIGKALHETAREILRKTFWVEKS